MKELILIVEDSLTQAMILENFLQKHNFEVAIASDGQKAIDWLFVNKPALVISDIVMPDMNGFDLCKRIKSVNSTDQIPVILLTSLNDSSEIMKGIACGADSFVTKPYIENFLLSIIEKLLSGTKVAGTDSEIVGLEISFEGRERIIQADNTQINKLLLSVYDGAIHQNAELIKVQEELRLLNNSLESLVEERTNNLASQNALLNALINSPGDIIIFSLNTEYCYLTFNENHRQEMKKIWNADIQLNTNLLDCIHVHEIRRLAKISIDRSLKGESFSEIQHQPDTDIYYEFNWNPIVLAKNIVGVTAFIKDISEKKRAEFEIRVKNKQLIQLNSEKDKFFSIIAHDLKSPFSGFLGLTQMMVDDLPSMTIGETQQIAESMSKSATNLFRLLENLLQWSQMQQGAISFNPNVAELLPLIEESIAMVMISAENKGIEIACNIPDGKVCYVDSNILQTVIRNLVSNAVKFTPKGGKVTISAKPTDDKCVEISVKDTGIGMNPEMVENLFRLGGHTNRNGTDGEPSTGLGLMICKDFIEKHGGKIKVDSKEGIGSVFSFTIPEIE